MKNDDDFFAEADELLQRLEWINDVTSKHSTLHVSPEDYVDNLNNNKRYKVYQSSLSQFRNLLAIRLARSYEKGQKNIQSKIKEALDIHDDTPYPRLTQLEIQKW